MAVTTFEIWSGFFQSYLRRESKASDQVAILSRNFNHCTCAKLILDSLPENTELVALTLCSSSKRCPSQSFIPGTRKILQLSVLFHSHQDRRGFTGVIRCGNDQHPISVVFRAMVFPLILFVLTRIQSPQTVSFSILVDLSLFSLTFLLKVPIQLSDE